MSFGGSLVSIAYSIPAHQNYTIIKIYNKSAICSSKAFQEIFLVSKVENNYGS